MEAGFLNFHDEERFTSDLYEQQSNGFESENSLFGGFMANYNGQFDALPMEEWITPDHDFAGLELNSDLKEPQEDFQKTFQDWQAHISNLKDRDDDDKAALLCEPTDFPDIFSSLPPPCTTGEVTAHPRESLASLSVKEEPDNEVVGTDHNLELIKTEIFESPVFIKKEEDEEECVDVETVETMPMLVADDLKTLFEQFEASSVGIEEGSFSPKVKEEQGTTLKKSPTNKSIRDALPKEVVKKIKESSKRKKAISLVSAVKLPSGRNGTRMHDAGVVLSRNKLLKIVSGNSGESVQLDHDYCSNSSEVRASHNFYGSEKSEYKTVECRSPASKEKWKNSKKDSGLESGEMSDASEELQDKSKHIIINKIQKSVLKNNQENISPGSLKPGDSVLVTQIKVERSDVPMISVLKPIIEVKQEVEELEEVKHNVLEVSIKEEASSKESIEVKQEQKKKKLNLEEYRRRRKNMKPFETSNISLTVPSAPLLEPVAPLDPIQPKDERVMINPEIQSQNCEVKNVEENKTESWSPKRRSRRSYKYRRSSSSSSSSSDDSRSFSKRRSRKRRRYSRNRQRSVWSRSRSRSSSSDTSSSSSSSRSRSRSRTRSRSRSRSSRWRSKSRSSKYTSHVRRNSGRWTPPRGARRQDDWTPKEKQRQVEERRVIYVGQIEEGTTKAQLRGRFQCFGPIVDISLHFRERGDNYGFVTFAYKIDAYDAVEHGNDNPLEPRYDICFGGRRAFCKQRYSDLDGATIQGYSPFQQNSRSNDSFDNLLREAQENLRKRSCV